MPNYDIIKPLYQPGSAQTFGATVIPGTPARESRGGGSGFGDLFGGIEKMQEMGLRAKADARADRASARADEELGMKREEHGVDIEHKRNMNPSLESQAHSLAEQEKVKALAAKQAWQNEQDGRQSLLEGGSEGYLKFLEKTDPNKAIEFQKTQDSLKISQQNVAQGQTKTEAGTIGLMDARAKFMASRAINLMFLPPELRPQMHQKMYKDISQVDPRAPKDYDENYWKAWAGMGWDSYVKGIKPATDAGKAQQELSSIQSAKHLANEINGNSDMSARQNQNSQESDYEKNLKADTRKTLTAQENKLREDFTKSTEDYAVSFNQAGNTFRLAEEALKGNASAGPLLTRSIIRFVEGKGSRVSESDVENVAMARGILSRYGMTPEGAEAYLSGAPLTKEQVKEVRSAMKAMMYDKVNGYESQRERFEDMAKRGGMDPRNVTTGIESYIDLDQLPDDSYVRMLPKEKRSEGLKIIQEAEEARQKAIENGASPETIDAKLNPRVRLELNKLRGTK